MWERIVEIDQDIFRFFNSLWIGKFQDFWIFITQIEHWIPLYIFFFYLLYRHYAKAWKYFAIASVLILASATLYLTNLVKNYVARLRPNNEPLLMDSIIILQRPENFSFWSGHSAVSFAVTTFVVLSLRKKGISKWMYAAYLWPVLFAFSRLFVGVHYPADISVGMIVGISLGMGAHFLFQKTLKAFTSPD